MMDFRAESHNFLTSIMLLMPSISLIFIALNLIVCVQSACLIFDTNVTVKNTRYHIS